MCKYNFIYIYILKLFYTSIFCQIFIGKLVPNFLHVYIVGSCETLMNHWENVFLSAFAQICHNRSIAEIFRI